MMMVMIRNVTGKVFFSSTKVIENNDLFITVLKEELRQLSAMPE